MLSFYEFFNILENQKRKNIAEATFNLAEKEKARREREERAKQDLASLNAKAQVRPIEFEGSTKDSDKKVNPPTAAPTAPTSKRGIATVDDYDQNLSKFASRMGNKNLKPHRPELSKYMKNKSTEATRQSDTLSWFNGVVTGPSYYQAVVMFIKKFDLEENIKIAKKIGSEFYKGKEIPKFALEDFKSLPINPYFWPVNNFEEPDYPVKDLYGDRDVVLFETNTLNALIEIIKEYFNVRTQQNVIQHIQGLEGKLLKAADGMENEEGKKVFYLAYHMSQYMFSNELRNKFNEDYPYMKKEDLAYELKKVVKDNLSRRPTIHSYDDVNELEALNKLIEYSKEYNIFTEDRGLIGINYDFSDTAKISSADWSMPKMKKENADYIDVMDLMEYWGN